MRLDIKRATIIGLLSNDFFVRGPKMVWQPLSKAHRLLFGKGPGIGPYRVRYLDLYARGCKILPMPCIPDNLCRDLRIGCIPLGRSCQASFKTIRLPSLPHESFLRKEILWGMPHFPGKCKTTPPPQRCRLGGVDWGRGINDL